LALELNSSQGNPMVLVEEERIISAGNFDIAPLAAAIDYARICLAPALTSACERTVKLLQAPSSGLPQGLSASHPSPEDALSEFAVAIVALTSEARLLAQPVSFELASTSIATGIEDRMTMAPLAARRLSEMVELGLGIASIELTVAAQALDLRGQAKLGEGTSRAYRLVRQSVPFAGAAQPPPVDLEPVRELARSNALTPPL
jgi:histidine ammonia-lyase